MYPWLYRSCAWLSVSFGLIEKLLYASVCMVVKSNGCGGACVLSLASTLVTVACLVTLLCACFASSSFSKRSCSCFAVSSFVVSSTSQYGTGVNAAISCSLSASIFSAGVCTRPEESILKLPAAFTALVSALLRFIP